MTDEDNTFQQKLIEHPLEEVFGIESGTTVVEYQPQLPAEPLVAHEAYDDKDKEIEQQFQDLYTMAVTQAETVADEITMVEGKFKARMGEVSATLLNVALGAAREKAAYKMHKDKLKPTTNAPGAPGTVNNNLIVADRNELIRALMDGKKNG